MPIDLFDESGKEVKITKDKISKIISDHNSTNENKIVVLGNNGERNVEITTYIDVKPFGKYIDESTKEIVYYKATNMNDNIKAIGIALQNDENISPIEYSIEDFKDDNIKRI